MDAPHDAAGWIQPMDRPLDSTINRLKFVFPCRTARCGALIEFAPAALSEPVVECPRCGGRAEFHLDGRLTPQGRLTACPMCGCPELFVRKDFPPAIGVCIVIIAGLASIWFLRSSPSIAYAILAGAALLDLVLYLLFPKVTVCYRCRAELRGVRLNPDHHGFDLATREKYS